MFPPISTNLDSNTGLRPRSNSKSIDGELEAAGRTDIRRMASRKKNRTRLVAGAVSLGSGEEYYATFFSSKNCSSSVEPCSAVVELWFCWMVWVTASK